MKQYIEKDMALSFPFANGQYDDKNVNEHFIFGCETYKEWLAGLPVHDVTPVKHAHWNLVWDDEGARVYECSTCHEQICVPKGFGVTIMWFRYCIKCGAKMDETPKPIET